MASFDVISEVNIQEIDNAVNQAKKEVTSRYDFRGSKAEIAWDKSEIQLSAEDDYKMGAMKDILLKKLHHRGIDIQALDFDKIQPAGGMMLKQKVTIKQGIDKETAKKIIKFIKDSGLKVQAQVQEEKVRVTSKSIDTLRECMGLIRAEDFEIPIQFDNLR